MPIDVNIASAYAPLIDFNISFFIQIFNTLVLFAFLSWKLFKPVTAMLEKRRQNIVKSFDDADKALKEAEELKLEYENKLKEIREEKTKIIEEAKDNAKKRADEILKSTELEVKALKESANHQIEVDRTKAMAEMKDEIAAMAVLAAAKILKKEIDSTENRKMIKDFIDEVGDVTWDN